MDKNSEIYRPKPNLPLIFPIFHLMYVITGDVGFLVIVNDTHDDRINIIKYNHCISLYHVECTTA